MLAADLFQGMTNQIIVASFFHADVYPIIPEGSAIIMKNARHHHGWVQQFLEDLFQRKKWKSFIFHHTLQISLQWKTSLD
jgi:hypothetical protein